MLRWIPQERISAEQAMAHPFLARTEINPLRFDIEL
jgi:hypothetical protein